MPFLRHNTYFKKTDQKYTFLYIVIFSLQCHCRKLLTDSYALFTDVYGQGRNAARVRQQSCNAAIPEVRLQGRGACTGFLRQILASRLDGMSTRLLS